MENGSGHSSVAELTEETFSPTGLSYEDLIQEIDRRDILLEVIEERNAQLELGLEEIGWIRLGETDTDEFSPEGRRRMVAFAKLMYLKNPLINRGIDVQAHYVWAQGWSVKAKNEIVQEIVDDFVNEPSNRRALTSMAALMEMDVEQSLVGNRYFTFFVTPSTGATLCRTIPPNEITEIVTNPEDALENWYYLREWTETTGFGTKAKSVKKRALYPDWRYRGRNGRHPRSINGIEVRATTPVHHTRSGGLPRWKFGAPEIYAALDWGQAYTKYLNDCMTVSNVLARFALTIQTRGGERGVQAVKSRFSTTISAGNPIERNPAPAAGSTFVSTDGSMLQAFRTQGARPDPNEARPIKLMIAAGMDLPETFFGDADTGNLATAKTLDRPTELKMRARQVFWQEVLKDIFEFVLQNEMAAPNGRIKGVQGKDRYGVPVYTAPEGIDPTIQVLHPNILERDVNDRVESVVAAATLEGKTFAGLFSEKFIAKLLLEALDYPDQEAVLKEMYPEPGEGTPPGLPEPASPGDPALDPSAPPTEMQLSKRQKESLLTWLRGQFELAVAEARLRLEEEAKAKEAA